MLQLLGFKRQFVPCQAQQVTSPKVTRATMVTRARAHSMAKLIRASAYEDATVDEELAMTPSDPWAREERDAIKERFVVLEAAEEPLHELVMSVMDKLEEARASSARARPQSATSASGLDRGTGDTTTDTAGTTARGSMERGRSLSNIASDTRPPHFMSPRALSPARAPVVVLGLPPQPAPPPPRASVPVRGLDSTAPHVPQLPIGTVFMPVTLPCAGAGPLVKSPPPVLGQASVAGGMHVTPLVRAQSGPATFIMPGVDIRYGKSLATPATPPEPPRREPLPWGITSGTAPTRHGPPTYFEDVFPFGWKLIMGDLPADTTATEARRMRRMR